MAYDLLSGKLTKANFALSGIGDDDPILWTSASARAEFDRIRTMLDTVNLEMSQAVKDGKLSGDEWKQWFSLYKTGHKLTSQGTWLRVSKGDIIIARKIEQNAKGWHDLVESRGGKGIGPKGQFRKDEPTGGNWFWPIIGGTLLVGTGLMISKKVIK
jgi:hypothetical protein